MHKKRASQLPCGIIVEISKLKYPYISHSTGACYSMSGIFSNRSRQSVTGGSYLSCWFAISVANGVTENVAHTVTQNMVLVLQYFSLYCIIQFRSDSRNLSMYKIMGILAVGRWMCNFCIIIWDVISETEDTLWKLIFWYRLNNTCCIFDTPSANYHFNKSLIHKGTQHLPVMPMNSET